MSDVRLHKYIADAGVCSRREAEELMRAGRVRVNGTPARQPGTKIDPDRVTVSVDGREIAAGEGKHYIVVNKPRGVVCTCRSQGGPTVIDLVDVPARVYPVGRLDKDSEGLVLLTNDGELAEKLMHPRYGHEKEYVVRVNRPLQEGAAAIMARGVVLKDGTKTAPAEVKELSRRRMRITLREGKKRQIRRMCEALGYAAVHLTRVRLENVKLGRLPTGGWRRLTPRELNELRRRTGVGADAKQKRKT